MWPWPSSSTCAAASPCARLSRAPSTTSGSDFRDSVGLPMDGPFSRPTQGVAQDRRGSPRFRHASLSARAVLSDPAGVSGPLALAGTYWCLPSFRPCRPPVDRITRLHRFTCVTARTSLCLRLAHRVTSIRPRLDSRWGGSFPLPGRESHPLEAPGLAWRTEKFSADRPDDAFHEWVGHRHMRHRLELIDLENPQVRLPPMRLEEGIMIGAQMPRHALTPDS